MFFILTVGMFSIAAHRSQLHSKLGVQETQTHRPYFHALISDKQNISWISRKLRELPGVELVEVLPQAELNQQVKQLLAGMDQEVIQAVGMLDVAGIKVIAGPELETRSIDLIKDYLKRLAGSETTIGATVVAPKLKSLEKFQWQNYSIEIALAVVAMFWLISIFSLVKPLRKNSYLIEQFQRRHQVALKTWGVVVSMSVMISVASAFAWRSPDLIALGICSMCAYITLSVYTKRSSWEG